METDAQGISAASLRSILENWPQDKPRPKILYTVPVSFMPLSLTRRSPSAVQYGCNPTGMTATLDRRVQVLKLAREFDLIILEGEGGIYPQRFIASSMMRRIT